MSTIHISLFSDLIEAFKERNNIEKDKLSFDKKVFELNKEFSDNNMNTNSELVNTLKEYAEINKEVRDGYRLLMQNQKVLFEEIQSIKEKIDKDNNLNKENKYEYLIGKTIQITYDDYTIKEIISNIIELGSDNNYVIITENDILITPDLNNINVYHIIFPNIGNVVQCSMKIIDNEEETNVG